MEGHALRRLFIPPMTMKLSWMGHPWLWGEAGVKQFEGHPQWLCSSHP